MYFNLKNVLFKQFFKIFHVVSATWCMMSTATQKQIIVMNLGRYSILGVHLTKNETLDWNYGVFFLGLKNSIFEEFSCYFACIEQNQKKNHEPKHFLGGPNYKLLKLTSKARWLEQKNTKFHNFIFLVIAETTVLPWAEWSI